jgi:hypothetical protein
VRELQDHAQQVQVVAVRHAGQVQVEPGELADVLYVEIYLRKRDDTENESAKTVRIFKGKQALNFFFTFIAETESLWSQEPVTRDF